MTTATALAPPSRRRILDAAVLMIAESGFEGMTLQRLADAVGLHKSSLFHHFRSKGQVAEEALCEVLEPVVGLLEELEHHEQIELEQLVETAERLVDHFANDRAAARFLLRCMLGPEHFDPRTDQDIRENRQHPIWRIFVALGGWLDRARKAGVTRPLRLRQALLNLIGLVLLYPSIAEGLGRDILGADPSEPDVRAARKQELAASLRGAFAPLA